jgi:hypothetical protein
MPAATTAIPGNGSDVVRSLLAKWCEAPDPEAALETGGQRPGAAAGVPDRALQRHALLALRQRFEALPLGRIHPSWIGQAIPADPLLRLWCLSELPRAERQCVVRELAVRDRPAILTTPPPTWFAAWWHRHLRAAIRYPWPASEAADRSLPFTYLDRIPAEDLLRLLRCFGLRALAGAMRALDRQAVVALAVALPTVSRDRLAGHSRSGRYPDPSAWLAVLETLRKEDPPAADFSLLLALEDVGAQGAALGEQCAAARIAYRLPAHWGGRLLARLERGPGKLRHPAPEQWQRDLVTDLGHLTRSGAVKPVASVRGRAA